MEKSDLSNTIREFIASIDENGELPLLKRYSLRELLNGNNDQEVDHWHVLESISAHKVLEIWERHFPSEPFPVELLRLADSLMIEAGDVRQLSILLSESKAALDDKLLLGEQYFPAVYAGFASWAAARNIAYGSPEINYENRSEIDIDPEQWDASFLASLAWAGGAVWEEIGASKKRREFWLWFLEEALPQALHRG